MAYVEYNAVGWLVDLDSATIAEEEVATISVGNNPTIIETMLVMTFPAKLKATVAGVELEYSIKVNLPQIGNAVTACINAINIEGRPAEEVPLDYWNALSARFIELENELNE